MPRLGLVLAFTLASLLGCAARAPSASHRLLVVASTTLLASLAAPIAGTRAEVTSVVPVGASPETFEPSPADVAHIADARLIIVNGAGLETWFNRTVSSAVASGTLVVTLADGLPVRNGNPHLWLDPQYARRYVAKIRDGLVAVDPAGAAEYRQRAAAFDARLAQLDAEIRRKIGAVPAARRAMLVYHPAWFYYDRRFEIRLIGTVQEQPGREPSPEHLARLVDAARRADLRTVYTEPEYDPRLIRSVAESAGISRVVVLYDDSVGTSPQTRDYVAMMRFDTDAIVRGMR